MLLFFFLHSYDFFIGRNTSKTFGLDSNKKIDGSISGENEQYYINTILAFSKEMYSKTLRQVRYFCLFFQIDFVLNFDNSLDIISLSSLQAIYPYFITSAVNK